MKPYLPVKYQDQIKYPTLSEVKSYTETYRVDFMDRDNPDKGWHNFHYCTEVEVLVIGGINKYFLVYAYPPAGITIAKPEDVLGYQLWRGWILELVGCEPSYRLDTSTFTEGYAAFIRRKTELGY